MDTLLFDLLVYITGFLNVDDVLILRQVNKLMRRVVYLGKPRGRIKIGFTPNVNHYEQIKYVLQVCKNVELSCPVRHTLFEGELTEQMIMTVGEVLSYPNVTKLLLDEWDDCTGKIIPNNVRNLRLWDSPHLTDDDCSHFNKVEKLFMREIHLTDVQFGCFTNLRKLTLTSNYSPDLTSFHCFKHLTKLEWLITEVYPALFPQSFIYLSNLHTLEFPRPHHNAQCLVITLAHLSYMPKLKTLKGCHNVEVTPEVSTYYPELSIILPVTPHNKLEDGGDPFTRLPNDDVFNPPTDGWYDVPCEGNFIEWNF